MKNLENYTNNYNSYYLHGKMYICGLWYKQDLNFGLSLMREAAVNGNKNAIDFLNKSVGEFLKSSR